jgi:hypothetical protein
MRRLGQRRTGIDSLTGQEDEQQIQTVTLP